MKKLFAILLTAALLVTSAAIVLANDYEDKDVEYDYVEEDHIIFPEIDLFLGWWVPDDREFDSLIDELVYRRFGTGSDFLFGYATEIGRTYTAGQFEIEVVGSLAMKGPTFNVPIWHWPDVQEIEWDEETGMIIWPDFDDVYMEDNYVTVVEAYVFIAIRDLTGELDLLRGGNLELAFLEDELGFRPFMGWATGLHVARDTDRAYFVIQIRDDYEVVPDLVDISFELGYFLSGFVWESSFAGIDIVALLESHEAGFVYEVLNVDEELVGLGERWGFVSPQLAEIMGEDFDPLSFDFEVMAQGELDIRLADSHYLTNIALTDDVLLRIQMTVPQLLAARPGLMGWSSVFLVDTRLEAQRDALVAERDAIFLRWQEEGFDFDDPDLIRINERLNEIGDSRLQDLYTINLTRWWETDAPSVNEHGYYISDLDLLNHLDFMITSSFHETQEPIPFSFSGSTPVLDFGIAEFYGTHSVFVHDRYLNMTDVVVSMTQISFNVQDTAFIPDLQYEGVFVFDLFEIEYIMADGEIIQIPWFGGSSWSHPHEGDELSVSNFTFAILIDIRELVGVRINGTEIR